MLPFTAHLMYSVPIHAVVVFGAMARLPALDNAKQASMKAMWYNVFYRALSVAQVSVAQIFILNSSNRPVPRLLRCCKQQ